MKRKQTQILRVIAPSARLTGWALALIAGGVALPVACLLWALEYALK